MTRWATRCSRCICSAITSGSPRSHPSERMTTTAPLAIPRTPHWSLNSRSPSPSRVPPDQPARLGQLVVAALGEILVAQDLGRAVTHGDRGIVVLVTAFRRRRARLIVDGQRDVLDRRIGSSVETALPPIGDKDPIVEFDVFGSMYQRGPAGPVAALEPDSVEGTDILDCRMQW